MDKERLLPFIFVLVQISPRRSLASQGWTAGAQGFGHGLTGGGLSERLFGAWILAGLKSQQTSTLNQFLFQKNQNQFY